MQRIHQASRLIGFLIALLLVQGCVNLKPQENTTRFYVLGATGIDAPSTPAGAPSGLSIGLRRLRLAAYLDTPYIVLRLDANEVSFSEHHRWGEDLRSAINRIVAGHMASHSSIQRVDVVPWLSGVPHDYVIQIHVLHFEGVAETGGEYGISPDAETQRVRVRMVATWQILDPGSNRILRQGTTDVTLGSWTLNIYANMVAGLERALETLAQDLVSALSEFE